LNALIGRIAQGDQAALGTLYDRTSATVYGLAVKILRNESAAEEVTIEVYMQVFRQAWTYKAERGSPLAWLVTLTRSRAIDRLRSERRRRLREDPIETIEAMPATSIDPVDSVLADESQRAVRLAVGALSPEQRRVIELAYYTGMSHREIAEALGQPLGTVKTRIRTAMLALRDGLRHLHVEAHA
jgi:RNA polymerase sigma-70 factor (ECF subfamily)